MKKIFLDLDGTLARFNVPNALNRFDKETGFFARLKPYKGIGEIDRLAQRGNVYIISASPNLTADLDKMQWVQKYIPNIQYNNIVICRIGENKAKVIESKYNIEINEQCYLLDDYTKNLNEWEQYNGSGIKRLTGVADNSRKLWKGLTLKDLIELQQLFN
mgnify:CR=1 FL=1